MVGRVFALVELVRSLADYIIAPIIMKIARVRSHQPPLDWPGVHQAAIVTLWLIVGFTVLGVALVAPACRCPTYVRGSTASSPRSSRRNCSRGFAGGDARATARMGTCSPQRGEIYRRGYAQARDGTVPHRNGATA